MSIHTISQAAEVGGSYEDALGDMSHSLVTESVDPFNDEDVLSEQAWHYYNTGNGHLSYAMPPDIYRYNNLIVKGDGEYSIRHRQTTTDQLKAYSDQLKINSEVKTHYYRNISGKAGRIINFFNTGDVALTAWEFNQLSKPDYAGDIEWDYSNEHACIPQTVGPEQTIIGWHYPDGSVCPGPYDSDVDSISRFYRNDVEITWNPEIPSGGYSAEQRNYLEIMGYIIPARTESLGQIANPNLAELKGNAKFDEFTNSNQGHSSQFHGYLSETGRGRVNYWKQVMNKGFDLKTNKPGDYSGLHPDVKTGTH